MPRTELRSGAVVSGGNEDLSNGLFWKEVPSDRNHSRLLNKPI